MNDKHDATIDNVSEKEENKKEESCACEEKIKTCHKATEEWKNNYVRLSADFDNFKRRIAGERALWMQMAQSELLRDILPIVDDFERALPKKENELETNVRSWLHGFTMVHKAFSDLLHKIGVKEITVHDTFDPEHHEAIAHVNSPDHESGSIVAVMQKGYRFKDVVLRPAKVSIAK